MEEPYPLHRAAANGDIRKFRNLFYKGLGHLIYQCDKDNKMPLMIAIEEKQEEILKYFFKKIGLNGTPPGDDHPHKGTTFAWWLAFYGELQSVMIFDKHNRRHNPHIESLNLNAMPQVENHDCFGMTLMGLMKKVQEQFHKRPADQGLDNPAPEKKPKLDEDNRSPSPTR